VLGVGYGEVLGVGYRYVLGGRGGTMPDGDVAEDDVSPEDGTGRYGGTALADEPGLSDGDPPPPTNSRAADGGVLWCLVLGA
jgi:hypothetical protein